MKLHLQNIPTDQLLQMQKDFQDNVNFHSKKYDGPVLTKFKDLLDQVEKEIKSRS
jgi:hypothetical protein